MGCGVRRSALSFVNLALHPDEAGSGRARGLWVRGGAGRRARQPGIASGRAGMGACAMGCGCAYSGTRRRGNRAGAHPDRPGSGRALGCGCWRYRAALAVNLATHRMKPDRGRGGSGLGAGVYASTSSGQRDGGTNGLLTNHRRPRTGEAISPSANLRVRNPLHFLSGGDGFHLAELCQADAYGARPPRNRHPRTWIQGSGPKRSVDRPVIKRLISAGLTLEASKWI